MLYKQDLLLRLYFRKIKEEPKCWKTICDTKFRYELPKNSIIDLHSMRLVPKTI